LADRWGKKLLKTLRTRQHKALIALLIEKREALNMTQTVLAKRLGEYQSLIARIESGQRRVDVVEFLTLAEILEFDPTQALSEIKARSTPKRRK